MVHLLLSVAANKCLKKQLENGRMGGGYFPSISLLEFSNVCFKKNRKIKFRVRRVEIKDSLNYPAVE